ncbi:APC family permease [Anaerovorax odorimutans]|uniref:APC family permease n=1 Tax=Anaerovorax odorimutans TaxID=109327 RepID=A0ABT1RQW3_9FIRM|nr:APC family permease [Anaerovorax odorimutans]MCQ4637588.1 APC family permease [Anaerovorax odorimutans]
MSCNSTGGIEGVEGLKKKNLGPVSIAFLIYCLAAAGAFGIEEMIPVSGPGLTLLMLLIFAFIWSYPICNIVAETGSLLPSEGGLYISVQKAFGEFWGFQNGWWLTIAFYLSSATFVSIIGGYTAQLLSLDETGTQLVKLAVVIIFTIVNLLGLKEVSIISNILSVAILTAFALVCIVGLANWQHNPVQPFIPEETGLLEAIGNSICICVWMYSGYECIANIAGEVTDPQVIPRGLKIALPVIAVSYILPTLAGLASVGPWDTWSLEFNQEGSVGYATVLQQYIGPVAGYAFLVIAIISQCAIFNTYIASGSRGFFVMADDNLFPKGFVKVSKKRGIPYIGVISIALVSLLSTQFDFNFLAITTTVFLLAVYILSALAVLKLRKKYPIENRKGLYIIPGGKVGLYFCVFLVVGLSMFSFVINGTDYLLIGLIGMLSGPVIYIVCKIKYKGLTLKEPDEYKINPATRLAAGDMQRISLFIVFLGLIAFIAQFFIRLYEGSWGAEYYLETWGSGLLSNFELMLNILVYGGAAFIIAGWISYRIFKKKDPVI